LAVLTFAASGRPDSRPCLRTRYATCDQTTCAWGGKWGRGLRGRSAIKARRRRERSRDNPRARGGRASGSSAARHRGGVGSGNARRGSSARTRRRGDGAGSGFVAARGEVGGSSSSAWPGHSQARGSHGQPCARTRDQRSDAERPSLVTASTRRTSPKTCRARILKHP